MEVVHYSHPRRRGFSAHEERFGTATVPPSTRPTVSGAHMDNHLGLPLAPLDRVLASVGRIPVLLAGASPQAPETLLCHCNRTNRYRTRAPHKKTRTAYGGTEADILTARNRLELSTNSAQNLSLSTKVHENVVPVSS